MSAAATLAFFIICLNIILWVVFYIRFKKIFSTDEILTRTQTHLNNMLRDINLNASRNLELLEEKIRLVKSVTAETERKIEELKSELKKTDSIKTFEKHLTSSSKKNKAENKASLTSKYKANASQNELFSISEEENSKKDKKLKESFPQISYAKDQIVAKKTFASQVMELKQKGYPAEAIAHELGRSIQEVSLVLELGL